jgi:hypothetical protein
MDEPTLMSVHIETSAPIPQVPKTMTSSKLAVEVTLNMDPIFADAATDKTSETKSDEQLRLASTKQEPSNNPAP